MTTNEFMEAKRAFEELKIKMKDLPKQHAIDYVLPTINQKVKEGKKES